MPNERYGSAGVDFIFQTGHYYPRVVAHIPHGLACTVRQCNKKNKAISPCLNNPL